jgi:hypothetical protein
MTGFHRWAEDNCLIPSCTASLWSTPYTKRWVLIRTPVMSRVTYRLEQESRLTSYQLVVDLVYVVGGFGLVSPRR